MLTVKQRQLNLKHCGYYYSGKIDNIEGALTKRAYKTFQKDQKLKSNGVYDENTETALIEWVKELQRALVKAGFKLTIDGKVGYWTKRAIKLFQTKFKLKTDSIIGENTLEMMEIYLNLSLNEVDWKQVKYFKRKEFICPCNHCNGFPVEPDPTLLALLDRAREHFNLPIHITSGVRCTYQNNKVGGIKNSKHKQGKAADCSLDLNSVNDKKLLAWFKKQPEVSYTYTGFGAVHVDIK
jgi:hypothetical protein